MRAQALLLLLCAGAAALPAARAACQIDLPLASGSKLGVGGVFTFFASIPWPIWAWNKVPVTPSVRVTFPWSGSCNFSSSTVISSGDSNWVAAAAGAQLSSPTPLAATGDLIGRYGNFGFGRPGRRRSYQVDFTVSGFQFALASGPSNARVATRPVSVQQLSSSVAAGTGTLVYNINAPYGLGTGSGNFTFPLAGRAVDFAKGCSLAFRPAPYNDVLLDCSRLKVGLSRFNVASANGTSSVNVNIVFAGYKVKASAPITAATSA